MHFCEYFKKSSAQKFQNILIRTSVMKFREPQVEDSSFILIKRNCTRDNFFKFLEMRFIPLKKRRDKRPVKKIPVA